MVTGIVWNVGDDAGWSGQHQFDYTTDWAEYTPFLAGDDSLRFVYNPNTTNVLEVAFVDFMLCNGTSPLATYNSGDDIVSITKLHRFSSAAILLTVGMVSRLIFWLMIHRILGVGGPTMAPMYPTAHIISLYFNLELFL
ncbi:hypothetical protein MKW92_046227 [Papaver armeniacum]|nr:hypothetical protein MKW92_046227 [Papaver armeniacum]